MNGCYDTGKEAWHPVAIWNRKEEWTDENLRIALFGSPSGKRIHAWQCRWLLGSARRVEMSGFQSRIDSFVDWPPQVGQTPAAMSTAGFFYEGKADVVQTFCCGLQRKGWLIGEIPWTVHQRSRPWCGLRQIFDGGLGDDSEVGRFRGGKGRCDVIRLGLFVAGGGSCTGVNTA